MANEGIEIDVYSYADATVKVGTIFGRQKPQSLDEIGGIGGGQFNIATNDPHIAKKPELLESRNVCKIKVNGTVAQAFLVRDIRDVPITQAGETFQEVKGPGLKEWFDDADVYPFQPLKTFSPETRFFNFASEPSTWYSKYTWINPTELGRVRDKSLIWGSAPDKWPGGAEGAKWIWVEPYQQVAGLAPCYFRYTVNLASSGKYSIYSAVDDHYELYIDGEFIAKSSDKSSSHVEATRVVVQLGAGTHVIGYKAKNFPTDAETPDSPAALAMAMFKIAQGGKETLIGQSGGSGWKCLAYPTEAPGWTPGEVLLALINEAKTRGVRSMGWINPTFTADLDSYNNAWDFRREWSWAVGTSYADIITELEDLYDIWIDPNNYNLNIVPNRGAVRSAPIGQTPPVEFMLGKHVLSADVQSRAKITNNLLVKTDEGWIERSAGPTSNTKYGRIEGSMAVPGSKANAIPVAQVVFNQRAQPEEGASYELLMDTWVPITDFNVGDWVLAPDRSGNSTPRRIMSLSVTEDSSGNPVWTIEFDTIFKDNEDRLNRIISQLGGSGGASSSAGSSRPIGGTSGGGGRGGSTDPGSIGDKGVYFPPSTPGYDIQDEVPPPKPSGPIATARMGVVSVQWDGKDFNGLTMPFDFDHVEVMTGTGAGTSRGTLQAGLGNNTHHITGLAYNEPVTIWFVAVDVAGNKSDPSVSTTISTTPLVDTDIIGRVIADVNVKLGAIKSELLADGAVLTAKLADNAVSLAKLDSTTRDNIESAGTNATLANGRLTTSTAVPVAQDGVGKPLGAIWYRYSGNGTLLSTWRWNGTIWQQQAWGQDAIGAAAIVKEKLADNVVDSTKLAVAVNNAITQAGSDASTALTAANGKNKVIYSTSAASGTSSGSYSFVEGDTWFQRIGGLIIAQWQFGSGSWGARTLDNAIIANLDAGKITAGYLDAARINANTITADKLIVAFTGNLLPNSNFSHGLSGWTETTAGVATISMVTDGPDGGTTQILRIIPSAADQGITNLAFPSSGGVTRTSYEPGASYFFSMKVRRRGTNSAGGIRIRLGIHGEGLANQWPVVMEHTAAGGSAWYTVTGTYTMPIGNPRDKFSVSLHWANAVGATFEVAEIVMRPMATSSLIVDGSIIAGKIAANTVTATEMVAGTITAASGIIANAAIGTAQIADAAITNAKVANLDAGKITTGYLDAARIRTNSLLANVIGIGDFTNYASGSDFEDPALVPWDLSAPGFSIFASSVALSGSNVLRIDATTGSSNAYLNTQLLVATGDQIYVEFWMWRSSDWNGQPGNSKLRIGSGSFLTAVSYAASDAPSQVWTKQTHKFVVPEGVTKLSVMLTNSDATAGRVYLENIVIRRMFQGSLLVDGAINARELAVGAVTTDAIFARAITTSKIAADAVTANEIAALTIVAGNIASNAITTAKIAALQIEAGHIKANAITADKIDAGAITAVKIDTDAITSTKIAATAITSKHTITGAKFQTSATAARGIEITSAGFTAYNNSGQPTVYINASTGDATFIGTIRNRPSGPRVAINSSDTRATIWFYGSSEGGNILPAQISSDPNGQSLLLYGGNPSSTTPIYTMLQLNERTSSISWMLGRQGYDGATAYPRIRGDESTNSYWERSTGHRITLGTDGNTFFTGIGVVVSGSLSVSGSKNFAMDHPTKPDKTLVHASTESPHNGVEYWSDGFETIPAQGFKTVTLPPYFEALTAADHRVAMVTPGSPDSNLWVEEITDGKLIVHGSPGAKFSWLVKARRIKLDQEGVDTLAFQVERSNLAMTEPSEP